MWAELAHTFEMNKNLFWPSPGIPGQSHLRIWARPSFIVHRNSCLPGQETAHLACLWAERCGERSTAPLRRLCLGPLTPLSRLVTSQTLNYRPVTGKIPKRRSLCSIGHLSGAAKFRLGAGQYFQKTARTERARSCSNAKRAPGSHRCTIHRIHRSNVTEARDHLQ